MDESMKALRRLIEYARLEAQEQGLKHTGYFLEMAQQSVGEGAQHRPGDPLGPARSGMGDRGTGLQ